MFYVSSISGSSVGVTDTSDWTEEFIDRKAILEYAKQVRIYGVSGGGIQLFNLDKYINAIMAMDKLNDIESLYQLEDGKIVLKALNLPREMEYRVADGTFAIYNYNEAEGCSEEIFRGVGIKFSIVLPKSCKILGDCAFKVTNIKSINLEYVCRFGAEVFHSCGDLHSVSLRTVEGDNYKANVFRLSKEEYESQLGLGCFKKGTGLIGTHCFSWSLGLIDVDFGDFPRVSQWCFYACSNLKRFIAGSILAIEDSAFKKCRSLEVVEPFRNGVKEGVSIHEKAFTSAWQKKFTNLDVSAG